MGHLCLQTISTHPTKYFGPVLHHTPSAGAIYLDIFISSIP